MNVPLMTGTDGLDGGVANITEVIRYRMDVKRDRQAKAEALLVTSGQDVKGSTCRGCGAAILGRIPTEGPAIAAEIQTCGKPACVALWREDTEIYLKDGHFRAASGIPEVHPDGGAGSVRVDPRRRDLHRAGVSGELLRPYDRVLAGHPVEPVDPRKERSDFPARQFWCFSGSLKFLYVSGLLGTGKTRYAISIMDDYLRANRGASAVFRRVGDLGPAVSGHPLGQGRAPVEVAAIAADILVLDDLTLVGSDPRMSRLCADSAQRICAERHDGPSDRATIITASMGYSAPLSVPDGGWSKDAAERARQIEATGEPYLRKSAPWLASRCVEGWVVRLTGPGRRAEPVRRD